MQEYITIKQALNHAINILNTQNANLDARILLSYTLSCDQSYLISHQDATLSDKEKTTFLKFVDRRSKKEPIAYIINEKEFYGRTFYIDDRVLIPRPESEHLVEHAISILKKIENPHILDLCCGSGCIGITLAAEIPDSKVCLADISEKALEVAKINCKNLLKKKTEIICSDLFKNIPYNNFDLIISNPPYISKQDMLMLDKDLIFEPEIALYGGEEGIDYYKKIIFQAFYFLKKGGKIVLEIGWDQGKGVSELMHQKYENIHIHKDYSGHDRVVSGISKSE